MENWVRKAFKDRQFRQSSAEESPQICVNVIRSYKTVNGKRGYVGYPRIKEVTNWNGNENSAVNNSGSACPLLFAQTAGRDETLLKKTDSVENKLQIVTTDNEVAE